MTTRETVPAAAANLRALQRDLTRAQDDQIHRVLAVIDELAERGRADDLVAPLRGRLAQLRRNRKLNLTRLLFMPLNPLVVNAASWKPDAPSIPRPALHSLAHQVRDGLGHEAAEIGIAAAQRSAYEDILSLSDIGERLWSAGASILASARIPADWPTRTGLRPSDHAALASSVSSVLGQTPLLLTLIAKTRRGDDLDGAEVAALLEATASAGAQPLAMMIAITMEWLPRSGLLLRVLDDFAKRRADPGILATVETGLDFVLTRIEQHPLPSPDLARAASDICRVASILSDLLASSQQRPSRRSRVERVRNEVDIACRRRFAAEIETQLVVPSTDLAVADDETVQGLEATARNLRRFETAGRQIGSADQYDQHLHNAAQALRPAPDEDAATRISRVRLVEILRGPEAAAALLS